MAETPKIHQFDVDLCDYVRGTIRGQLGSPPDLQQTLRLLGTDDLSVAGQPGGQKAKTPVRKKGSEPSCDTLSSDQVFACKVASRLQPHPELRAYVFNELDGQPSLLLSLDELTCLAEATHVSDYRLDRYWVRWSELHRKYVNILAEIRQTLGQGTVGQVSRFSDSYATRLEAADLKLSDGVRIIADWIGGLREIKLAMHLRPYLPPPDGSYPTPSEKGLVPDDVLPAGVTQTHLSKLLKAIPSDPDSQHPDPETIVKKARINKALALKGLRYLEGKGLYSGFKRAPREREED